MWVESFQIKQPVIINNLSPALLTASRFGRCHIGGVSAQDQTMSRFIPLWLELFLDIETRHRTESLFCFGFVAFAAFCSIVELIVGTFTCSPAHVQLRVEQRTLVYK